ncbi:hypothetical protein MIH18_05900 [Marinobacter sp. M3C]|jgi:hypothetical protein|uniref:hypothetical protein n=1 Tax=unclassified Marinobacter TaxID=83889 RepID=UPI00201032EE|nr:MULTISPECIES: hypothetical protein [unclassified Marinobacter]MCL1479925.1 hypothetical protein [Marinobacter sp.]UQG57351.1 hypothetical protein MIH16_06830 [Marinobacter sp. M4C]UQG61475.1 hypothetical protein MIH18_05900 [Marinobacter sp. M3C]UQG66155.1 hypothetical protein MIH17_06830 [Marinobacter sp. M2C]UQG70435.1 hypothetical protein MIH19_06825 [Marinobacter sp. M1C]
MNSINEVLNNSPITIDLESLDWLPHQRVCEILGKGSHWAKGKIREGKWKAGEQFVRDPDGQIWVSIKGVKTWLLGNFPQASVPTDQVLKFDLLGKGSGTSRSGRGNQPKQTSGRQPVYELSSRAKPSSKH